jgi:CDP-diacylglycerol--glycerol-3-phosphate 3-phosphatidyltransferase
MGRRYVPNIITLCRLCSLPLVVYLYGRDAPGASWDTAVLVLVLALSDVADGYLARRYGWVTDFGRVLDPIADRLLFIALVGMLFAFGTLPWWAVVPVIARDAVLLLGAGILLVWHGEKPVIMRGGRISNIILISGIQFFIVDWRTVGWVFYGVGATLYVVTGVWYIVRQVKRMRGGRPQQAAA